MPSVTTRSDSSGAGGAGAVTAVPAAFAPLGELGRGAHTVVYKVRRTQDGAEYALKLLETSGPAGDGRSAAGFRREAALLACLDHPALARVHEVGESRGQPYLVMDYVDGRRLTEVLDAARSLSGGWWPSGSTWPGRWSPRTAPAWCTATSSRTTSSSWPTGAPS
jgi:serine/threonine protein kinase